MALVMALLVTLVCGSIGAAMSLNAGLERRAASAYAAAASLRHVASGAAVLAAAELEGQDWTAVLAGAGSAWWQGSVGPGTDVAGLSGELGRQTLASSAHGADTPSWALFVAAPWQSIDAGGPSGDVVVWVADDWAERDGDPGADTNGHVLVRAVAMSGVVKAWAETLCRREADGRVRPVHVRHW